MKRTGLVWDPLFIEHLRDPNGHPESPARLVAVYQELEAEGLFEKVTRIPIRQATEEDIYLNHMKLHYERIASSAGWPFVSFDPDTWATEKSFEAAANAAGSGIALAQAVLDGQIDNGFLLSRPPGHHALYDRTMGFCLFNNIAITAEYLVRHRRPKKIAIVDFDVHHGNGTQASFYDRPDILYCSTHQYPYFPGTGKAKEIGNGLGAGFTVNIPLPAGLGDTEYLPLYEYMVIPIVEEYQPDFILVSAGFDIHQLDPIGGMDVSTSAITQIADMLVEVADRVCDGRIVFFLEGGYHPGSLAESVAQCVRILMGDKSRLQRQRFSFNDGHAFDVANKSRLNLSFQWKCLGSLVL